MIRLLSLAGALQLRGKLQRLDPHLGEHVEDVLRIRADAA